MRAIRKAVSTVIRSTRPVAVTARLITGMKSTNRTLKEPEAYSKGTVILYFNFIS